MNLLSAPKLSFLQVWKKGTLDTGPEMTQMDMYLHMCRTKWQHNHQAQAPCSKAPEMMIYVWVHRSKL